MGEIKKRIDELEEERNQKLRHDLLERELNRYKSIAAANKMKVISGKKFEKQSTLDELKQGMNSFGGQQTILKFQ